MKLTVKLTSLLLLLLLASPLILLKGCGSKGGINGGGSSGACPDSVAPAGSTITVPQNLGAPAINATSCYNLGFQVIGPNGTDRMPGICVVITTGGNTSKGGTSSIALTTTGDLTCDNVVLSPSTQIITKTDDYGNVVVDMLTSSATTSGDSYFVEVSSGSISNVATTAKASGS
jgi:hypothetical protein